MAIKQPTTLSILTSAEIKVDVGNGATNISKIFANQTDIAFTSYSTGSIDISASTGDSILGTISAGIFSCTQPIDFITADMSASLNTKVFAYSGAPTTLSISSNSLTPVTVEYIIGAGI